MNPKKTILLIFICFFTNTLSAQSNEKEAPFEVKFEDLKHSLRKIIFFDSLKNQDSLRYHVNEGFALSKGIHLSNTTSHEIIRTQAEIYNYYGSNYYTTNDFSEALIGFRKAADSYKKLNIKNKLAQCINNMAIVYDNIGNQTKCLYYLHKSTSIFIDIKDTTGIILGFNNIAKIYRNQKDFQRTQEYLDKAIIIGRELNDSTILISVINSIAGLKKELGEQEEAISLYNEALTIAKKIQDNLKTALILNNLGVIYKNSGRLEDAKLNFQQAYNIALRNNSIRGEMFTLINLGDYYYLSNNLDKAYELANAAYQISDSIYNDEGKNKALILLIKIFKKQKDWTKTVKYQSKLITLKEKLIRQAVEQISLQETIRYKLETEKHSSEFQEDKAELNRENELQKQSFLYIMFTFLIIMLLTIALIFYIRLRLSRELNKEITKQSEERKLLLQEVHHRVKNNFQIVSSMLRLQSYGLENDVLRENFEEAVNRINAMAVVHDVIYRQEKFKDIDAKNYLERLVENLHKTGDDRIKISIDSEEIPFKIETLINMGIALNELISNSLKHAFTEPISHPEIKISLHTIEPKTYELLYKDNGVGIKKGAYTPNFGMDLLETIISNFEGKVEILDDKTWNTLIRITFTEI